MNVKLEVRVEIRWRRDERKSGGDSRDEGRERMSVKLYVRRR